MVEQVLVEDGVVDGVAVTDLAEVDGVAQQTVVGRPGRSTSCRSGCAARLSLSQFAITMAPRRSSTYLAKMACTTAARGGR